MRTDPTIQRIAYRGPLLSYAERLNPNRGRFKDPRSGKHSYPLWNEKQRREGRRG